MPLNNWCQNCPIPLRVNHAYSSYGGAKPYELLADQRTHRSLCARALGRRLCGFEPSLPARYPLISFSPGAVDLIVTRVEAAALRVDTAGPDRKRGLTGPQRPRLDEGPAGDQQTVHIQAALIPVPDQAHADQLPLRNEASSPPLAGCRSAPSCLRSYS